MKFIRANDHEQGGSGMALGNEYTGFTMAWTGKRRRYFYGPQFNGGDGVRVLCTPTG